MRTEMSQIVPTPTKNIRHVNFLFIFKKIDRVLFVKFFLSL